MERAVWAAAGVFPFPRAALPLNLNPTTETNSCRWVLCHAGRWVLMLVCWVSLLHSWPGATPIACHCAWNLWHHLIPSHPTHHPPTRHIPHSLPTTHGARPTSVSLCRTPWMHGALAPTPIGCWSGRTWCRWVLVGLVDGAGWGRTRCRWNGGAGEVQYMRDGRKVADVQGWQGVCLECGSSREAECCLAAALFRHR